MICNNAFSARKHSVLIFTAHVADVIPTHVLTVLVNVSNVMVLFVIHAVQTNVRNAMIRFATTAQTTNYATSARKHRMR